MMRFARDFRLIPVVLLATICLFALKVSGLIFDGGYTLGERLQDANKPQLKITSGDSVPAYPKIVVADPRLPASATQGSKQSWAQEMLNYGGDSGDVTGSVGGEKKPDAAGLKSSEKPPSDTKIEVAKLKVPIKPGHIASAGERAILERLQERRKELDNRSRELDMRESLLKVTEKRLEAKVAELKAMETKVNTAIGGRDKAEAQRLKSIVAMYENMKSKDAARILERLEMKLLVEVATAMKPAKMSDILAQMSPDAAEKLTAELARRADGNPQSPDQLPKIEGKPKNP